jgi:hypothetical protein
MVLGWDARGSPVLLSEQMRRSTHTHVIGGSGTGKSKFLEWMIGRDLRNGKGLCLIDWHGTLYNDVLRCCAYHGVGTHSDVRSVVLLNPSQPQFITGFNPFIAGTGDVSVQVSRRVDATIRPWGVTNTDQTPTFSRICRLLYTFMIENRQTLPNAATLLHFKNRQLREWAGDCLQDSFSRAEWEELQAITRRQDWKEEVLSTKNRLMRFVGSRSVRRFMGMDQHNINVMDVMEQGQILLVNLGSSDHLDREAARVFASLLLNEFFETAMRRATLTPAGRKPQTFTLYLDEFQEYITDDVASMLDQVRKGGLHMVLAHQHLGHFEDNKRLMESVFTNARIRAVFGGLSTPSACALAEEMFLPDLNTRQIKKAYYHTIHLYEEQTRTIRGRSSSWGRTATSGSSTSMSGPAAEWFEANHNLEIMSKSETESHGFSESESESASEVDVPVFVPIPIKELTSETEWSREEKVSRVAEMLKYQQQRHCFIKLDTQRTQPLKVPLVRDYRVPEDWMESYEQRLYARQGAIEAAEVDRILDVGERRFLLSLGRPDSIEVGTDPMEAVPAGGDEFFE